MAGIVVVGAGQAGVALVAKLRDLGYGGPLTLVGEEHQPPYQRPPLSKKYLLGEMEADRLLLRPPSYYKENDITLLLDTNVGAIDRADRAVIVGEHAVNYDQLALTTGAVARRLPPAIGGLLEGVHVVRTLRHVDAIAPAVQTGARVLVVGGGYIGLEAAAVCAQQGMKVTLIEMADRILQRVAAPITSDYFRDLHSGHGVDIREGVGLERLTGAHHVEGAVLTDGSDLPIDLVLVGIGITPATELAENAGLNIDNGIAVDAYGRSSDAAIWSAGDCASFPWQGERIRLESVQNAIDQAECVAANMLGAETPYDPVPWFWSDQYDIKLQIVGLDTGYDRALVRPGATDGAVSHWYFAGDTLLSVEAMNDPRAYMVGKRLLEMGKSPDPDAVEDPKTDLKSLLR
ncbi:MAG: FAD-dependent oxidoreductase [Pseudomonadota bacterium]